MDVAADFEPSDFETVFVVPPLEEESEDVDPEDESEDEPPDLLDDVELLAESEPARESLPRPLLEPFREAPPEPLLMSLRESVR